jgi:hypothetical protein
MTLDRIEWFRVPELWPAVERWLTDAINQGVGYAPDDIRRALLIREMTLWVVRDGERLFACAVTTLWSQPQVKVCHIVLVGGEEIQKWHHLIGELESWAKEQGCDEVREHGRPGWKRYAEQHGYEQLCTVYRKKL